MSDLPYNRFPAGPDKVPLFKGWQKAATNDPQIIEKWATRGAKAWGIPTGARNGLFVLDLDVDKETGERVGEASLRSMAQYARLLDLPHVITPSGGRHIYFQHFDGAKNSTSKIGPLIDTRGAGGFVIAPGSVTDAGIYVGEIPEHLPTFPLGLRAVFATRVPTKMPGAPKAEAKAALGEVEELLRWIPSDSDYDTWFRVLMALHDRYNGSEEGLAIADSWSAKGTKYRPGEVVAKWRSFKGSGVSWATVPALARANGADLADIARRYRADA